MHLALVDGLRTAPKPKMSGTCPTCGATVIAKCGNIRVHHWAHVGTRECDDWWERELQWHRDWKNRFPLEWQESVRFAENGEKHIADVRTAAGLVIEFQHSALNAAERTAREAFYGNMVWVVDGTRLTRDRPRFFDNRDLLYGTGMNGVFVCRSPEEVFPRTWVASTAPIFFDFGKQDGEEDMLWCLLPYRVAGDAIVVAIACSSFVDLAYDKAEIIAAKEIALLVAKVKALAAARQAHANRRYTIQYYARRQVWRKPNRRRF